VIEKHYVIPLDGERLLEAGLNGMLTSLDPHSEYLSPDSYRDLKRTESPDLGVFGLELTTSGGWVRIVRPIDGAPAARAGVQAGDVVVAVDGRRPNADDLASATRLFQGPVGSESLLTLRRGNEVFDIKLKREFIRVKTVRFYTRDDFGVLRVSSFGRDTEAEVFDALATLKQRTPGLRGLVLDLRGSPGGLFKVSAAVAGRFLDGGEVVTATYRDAAPETIRAGSRADLIPGVPMVVLVDSRTAGGAEIVAAALQDRHRATIVGLTTFGAGSMQKMIALKSGGAIRLTIGLFHRPAGGTFQRIGVVPDIEVAKSQQDALRLAIPAYIYSEASLRNALPADKGRARAPDHAQAPPPGFDTRGGDFQMTRALEVLATADGKTTDKR
jgi:carboxyl-terminal processing protease